MSTAGIYNARPAIIHGTEPYLNNQMKSHQVPHYFGGSQIPINLHHHMIKGNGMPHFETMEELEADSRQKREKYFQGVAQDKIAQDKMNADSLARGTIGKQKMDATIAGWRKVNPWTGRPRPTPTTPTAPTAPQIAGTGFFGDFMGGFSQGLDMMLGGGINDPQTYRKHTTGLSKAIGSNTYRTSKV
jgi:hypothetical protein